MSMIYLLIALACLAGAQACNRRAGRHVARIEELVEFAPTAWVWLEMEEREMHYNFLRGAGLFLRQTTAVAALSCLFLVLPTLKATFA